MNYLLIAGVGALAGIVVSAVAMWLFVCYYFKNAKGLTPETPKSSDVTCGACGTPILGQPLHVVVGREESFRYYKCPQCSTAVTVPLPG